MNCPKLYADRLQQTAFENAFYLLTVRKEGTEWLKNNLWFSLGCDDRDDVWNMAVFQTNR